MPTRTQSVKKKSRVPIDSKRSRADSSVDPDTMGDNGMVMSGMSSGSGGAGGSGGISDGYHHHPQHQQQQPHHQHPHPTTAVASDLVGNGYTSGYINDGVGEDGDNRTRNARAQRRHREKRKAMTAAVSTPIHPIFIPTNQNLLIDHC
jgi:hypothetical protein